MLEGLLLPALVRSPCLIAFSGGRDSSAVLALATDLARRQGLDDPVPLTFRYAQHPRTWEAEWQEMMVSHLGLDNWEIVDMEAEFDVLGPMARDVLLRYGLFWPPNSHTTVPMLQAAGRGSLVTGNGGDEVFTSLVRVKKMTPLQVFRSFPPQRAVMGLLVNALPLPLRLRAQYRRGLRFPWLRRAARREVLRLFVENSAQRDDHEQHYLERLESSRYLELSEGIAQALAADAGVALVEPFLEPGFFHALLSEAPAAGFPSRNAALEFFFADMLPSAMARRTSKAVFTESFWGSDSRDFAQRWDGEGLDSSLVDPEALRNHWLRPRPDLRSATALQAAWLGSRNSNELHT